MMSSLQSVAIGEASPTPIGPIWVAVSEQGLVAVAFVDGAEEMAQYVNKLGFSHIVQGEQETQSARQQICEYLDGKRRQFDLPIDWSAMTPFQRQARQITFAIPYGAVMTYADIAHEMGRPHAARAVGRSNATNPMPLVIPCHRVIGSDGNLHGYGGRGGLQTKARLLQMEQDGTAFPSM
jgi:methylated-DNA-[protein]-cysteine S-methyltransferase